MKRVEKARSLLESVKLGTVNLRDEFHESEPEARESFVKNVLEVLDSDAFAPEKMQNGFKACGITTKLDGSEDHLVTVGKQLHNRYR